MTQLIASLFSRIESLADSGDENTLREFAAALERRGMKVVREALLQWFSTSADIDRLKALARETSTHYVWPLYLNKRGYGVTINEFKDPEQIVTGYATTLHNHRYSFVSLVLSGGYVQVRSHVDLLDPHRASQICDLSEEAVTEGNILTINHDEFHRLKTINRRTVTLIVKCPAAKGESLSVDTGTLRVTKHVPVEARVSQLMHTLVPDNEQRR